ncbi:MAG: 3-isopropylmalate dehydrogenase [Flavobacteriaceae bacterium]
MHLKIALLEGDGIGPEVVQQSVKCLRAIEDLFGHSFQFTQAPVGARAIALHDNPLPQQTLDLCQQSDAILFGAIGSLEYDQDPNAKIRPEQGLLKLRKELALFANIRPIKMFSALSANSPIKESVVKGVDLVIFRELLGGSYFSEKTVSQDLRHATDLNEYSEGHISRIAHLAFKAAKKRKKKITLADKANVLETPRLWRRTVMGIAESYPDVQLDCQFIDNVTYQLVTDPKQFDVILTDNMFGDVLNNLGSVIIGSNAILPSASIGGENAMFEPVHGSYPQAAGKNVANPVASILSAVLLLQHFGLEEEADALMIAVIKSFQKKIVTPDILGSSDYGTDYVGDFIASNIEDADEVPTMNMENIGLGKSTII